jgi:CelD/BcsL family acetyltransferase involved in cellulose biosynthesis
MKIERIRDPKRFQEIQDVWDKFLHSSDQDYPFLTHEWISSWWECFSGDDSLVILLLKDEKENPVGIAPLMVKKNSLRFIASEEVSDYCDFVVEKGKSEEFFKNVLNHIKTTHPDIEKIDLMNIKSTSPTLDILPLIASEWGYSCSSKEAEVAPILELPSSYENYLENLSKKKRHELRRKLRRMESLEGIRVEKITDAKNLPKYIDKFIALHIQGSPSKAKFWENPKMTAFFHEMAHRFSLRKWIELNVLFYEDRMLAALLNFSYADRIFFYNVAFDKDFARYSPGIYLFNHSIQEAISKGNKCADFLRGREKYKYYFGAEDSKIFRLILMPDKSL